MFNKFTEMKNTLCKVFAKACHCEECVSTTKQSKTLDCNFSRMVGLPRSHSFARNDKKSAFTLSCKAFRSDLDSSFEPAAQSDSQSSQTKYRNCVAHSYGFTLAEITVVLIVMTAIILLAGRMAL
ncbi:hypothetical protein IJS77_01870, partial [bacterium]|nr:hypothetical protein [bacterium]